MGGKNCYNHYFGEGSFERTNLYRHENVDFVNNRSWESSAYSNQNGIGYPNGNHQSQGVQKYNINDGRSSNFGS